MGAKLIFKLIVLPHSQIYDDLDF